MIFHIEKNFHIENFRFEKSVIYKIYYFYTV